MKYFTGEEIKAGDKVVIENGKTEGKVMFVIETKKEMNRWKIDEPGVLIESEPFGTVFWPISDIQDPVVFKERGG